MPDRNRHKKKTSRPSEAHPPRKSDSLQRRIHEIASKTAQARQESSQIVRRSKRLEQSAHFIHRKIEATHQNVDEAHKEIHAEPRKGRATPSQAGQPLLVVGIGASAGGFEAFSQLLENLRPDLGMALVFVQHLDPTHKSNLASLLSHATLMGVAEVRDRTRLAANRVYVIPPNTALTVTKGVLRLSPRKKGDLHLPVNHFFESLAKDQGSRAIGVVLSGNAYDGTEGLRQIKSAGGITFAQDPGTAKYPGMPESAEASGCVDYVLPPGGIAQELARVAHHGALKISHTRDVEPELAAAEPGLQRVFSLLRAATGVDFSCYKLTTLKRRITRRMALKRINHLDAYIRYLRENPAEIDLLFQDVLINVTNFFRDSDSFRVLKKKIFPRLMKQRPPGSPIRIWVPGCATGEEVYSLAISLHECLGKNQNNKALQIFGTDVNEAMIARARTGVYPKSIESDVSPERLRRFFKKTDNGGYQISKFIRDLCIFAKQNVAEDPPFSKLDLISCRNLLIYLGLPLQKKVLPTFHYSLRPGGYLMLGTSETIGAFSSLFSPADKKNKIYLRNETYSRPDVDFAPVPHQHIGAEHKASAGQASADGTDGADLQKKAEQILLSQCCPSAMIVNARMEVQHFLGKMGPFLEPATGTASLNLLKMVREELAVDLRTAFAEAAKTNAPARKEGVRMRSNGHFREVAIEVVPFKNSPAERVFLVLFRAGHGPIEESKHGGRERTSAALRRREAQQLRQELGQTRKSLQTIIEDQEATNEELKSANEEIQSSNEELQSTNEELETAKEELQSTNEELTTLNEELQNRNAELGQVNNDLNNLLGSFNMPIVMLSNDLTIRRFTPLAQKLFNLIPSDIGRRISDINPNIGLPDLKELVTEVIESLNAKEIEVQDKEGHWYSLRVRPYRTAENKIDGAVVVLVDIGEIRRGLEELLEMVPEPMLLLNGDLRVSKSNTAFLRAFKTEAEATEDKSIFKLGSGQWNLPALRSLLESVLPNNQHVEDFEVDYDFPERGRCVFAVNARRLYHHSKGTHYVLVLFREKKV
jgi:two-component system, chemotaxis family, CheB/CheR fusion protein